MGTGLPVAVYAVFLLAGLAALAWSSDLFVDGSAALAKILGISDENVRSRLSRGRKQLEEFVITLGDRPYIIQEYIFSSKGRDIRLEVVGDQVIAAMQRSNPMDFRANITNGGSMQPYNPTKEQVKMAVTACKVLGLDFAGVDILFGPGDKPLLCEVNSNAHFKNLFDCTRINAAEYIIKYIKSKFS